MTISEKVNDKAERDVEKNPQGKIVRFLVYL
jgi:hypothetical protein